MDCETEATELSTLEDGEVEDSDGDTAVQLSQDRPARPVAPSVSDYRNTHRPPLSSGESASDPDSNNDDGPPCKRPTRICPPAPSSTDQQAPAGRRRNNVWGSVLQEESLTQTITSIEVAKPECRIERDVESYGFMRANIPTSDPAADSGSMDDPSEREDEQTKTDSVDLCDKESFGTDRAEKKKPSVRSRLGTKRKNSERHRRAPVAERLGIREYDASLPRDHIHATADNSATDVVAAIMLTLGEPAEKIEVFERLVEIAGRKRSLELLYMTEDVETAGGMMTADGSRRRTAGGVYFTLLKNDPDVTREQQDDIFSKEREIWKNKCKQRKKEARKRAALVRQVNAERAPQGDTQADMDAQTDRPPDREMTEMADLDGSLDEGSVQIELMAG